MVSFVLRALVLVLCAVVGDDGVWDDMACPPCRLTPTQNRKEKNKNRKEKKSRKEKNKNNKAATATTTTHAHKEKQKERFCLPSDLGEDERV